MPTTSAHSRRRVGFSLVETALCLAITGVVLGMTVLLANTANMSAKTNDVNQEVQAIANLVHNLSASQGSYLGINATYLATPVTLANGSVTTQLPSKWINASGPSLSSAFGTVNVTTLGGAPTTFNIIINSIPNQACTNLATLPQGTGLSAAYIDTVQQTFPMTPSAASAACLSPPSNTYKNNHKFEWTFY
jgi:hypothetical protein